jgi:putative transcriptional regulator
MEKCNECNNTLGIIKGRPYHYKESGLDHVWLIGIPQYKCKNCGEHYVEIPRINDLHLLIGEKIVCKKGLLTGQEVRFLRKEIGMKSKEMAAALSIKAETYSRWENSRRKVESCHDKALRMMYVMSASELTGKVLSRDSHSILNAIAVKEAPRKIKKLEFKPEEWLNRLYEPIFGLESCVAQC